MGVIIRQSGYVTVIYIAGILIGYVNLLILYPLALSLSQIGLYRIFLNLALLLGSVSTFGSWVSIVKYFRYVGEDKIHKSQLFNLFLYWGFLTFIFLSFLLIIFRYQITDFYNLDENQVNFVYWLIPLVLLIGTSRTTESFGAAQQKGVIPELINEVFIRACLLIVLLLIYFKVGDYQILLPLTVLVYLLSTIIIAIYVKAPFKNLLKGTNLISTSLKKEIFNFASIMLFMVFGNVLIQNIDILMLGVMVGLEKTGIYAIALFIGNVIVLPRKSIVRISAPVLMQAWKDNNFEEVKTIYSKSALNGLILAMLAFGLVWINLEDLFSIIPNGEELIAGSVVVLIIASKQVIDAMFGINSEIIIASDNYKFNLYAFLLLGFLTILLNLALIPIYGIMGAALASLLSVFVFNIVKWLHIYKRYGFQPFKWPFIPIILSGMLIFFIFGELSFSNNTYFDIILKSTLYVFILSLILYFSKVSTDIREIMDLALSKIWKRNK